MELFSDTPMEFPIDKETNPMDLMDLPAEKFEWMAEDFYQAAEMRQFCQALDSPSPYFHSRVQYRLIKVGFDIRPMHTAQRWLHWGYLKNCAPMAGLLNKLSALG